MGEAMQYYEDREEYLNAKAGEVEAICAGLSEILDELKAEFGIEEELADMTKRTPLEEKLYQDFDLQLYKITDLFETGLGELIELAEAYDEEHK